MRYNNRINVIVFVMTMLVSQIVSAQQACCRSYAGTTNQSATSRTSNTPCIRYVPQGGGC